MFPIIHSEDIYPNVAGLYRIILADAGYLPRYLRPYGLSLSEIPLAAPGEWIATKPVTFSAEYSFRQREDNNGTFFSHRIRANIAKHTETIDRALYALLRKKLVALVEDMNGVWRLIGNKGEGLTISYEGTTGPDPRRRNEYEFTLEGTTRKPALFYTGELITAVETAEETIRVLEDGVTIRILE